jgi:predicted DCC family thiol-disulfide oxidoreductase YuxK
MVRSILRNLVLLRISSQTISRALRDAANQVLARRRYRIFGRTEVRTLPCDADHSRFLER